MQGVAEVGSVRCYYLEPAERVAGQKIGFREESEDLQMRVRPLPVLDRTATLFRSEGSSGSDEWGQASASRRIASRLYTL